MLIAAAKHHAHRFFSAIRKHRGLMETQRSTVQTTMLVCGLQPEGSSDTSTASKVAGVGKWAAQGAQSVARSAKNAVTGTDEAQENHRPAGSMQQRCASYEHHSFLKSERTTLYILKLLSHVCML